MFALCRTQHPDLIQGNALKFWPE